MRDEGSGIAAFDASVALIGRSTATLAGQSSYQLFEDHAMCMGSHLLARIRESGQCETAEVAMGDFVHIGCDVTDCGERAKPVLRKALF